MRIALLIVGGLIVIGIVIYAVGALLPKAHQVSRDAVLRVPPERLYAFIDGPQNWRPNVAKFEAVPDVGGRSLVRETTEDGSVIIYEITERMPPSRLVRRIDTRNLPYSGTWTFTLNREGDFTRVRITEDGEVYNPIFRFVARFIMGHSRSIDDYLEALRTATKQEIRRPD